MPRLSPDSECSTTPQASASASCYMPIIQTSSLPNQLNELALFAGAGGGILGGKLLGWRTVCAVEWDAYARDVLVARQNDGCLHPFPIWDDIQTFDGRPWRGCVDVVSGGFPCQDISAAGRAEGITGERSGLWMEMARIIGEIRPRFAFVENSPMLTTRGLGTCLGDLASLGYHARWGVVGAIHAGAPHKRERIWILAYTPDDGTGWREEQHPQGGEISREMANAESKRLERHRGDPGQSEISEPRNDGASVRHAAGAGLSDGIDRPMGEPETLTESERPDWWATEPELGRLAHGVANRVDSLRCLGNGQVPAVVRLAWNLLSQMNA
jgi:DNA (cytosine-5)-methyltransferase 1